MMGLFIGVLLIPPALLVCGNWNRPRGWVMLLGVMPIAIVLGSFWFLTSPEPGERALFSYGKPRQRLRVVAVTCVLLLMGLLIPVRSVMVLIVPSLLIASIVLVLSLGDFGFALANRLPNKRLALYSLDESRTVVMFCLLVLGLFGLIGILLGGYEFIYGGFVISAAIVFIFLIVLLSRFVIHLRRIVKQAFAQ